MSRMRSISRSKALKPVMTVDEVVEADRQWFDAHPGEDEYIREFCPGEFGKVDLPEIPPGFRYATHVSVMHRNEQGKADGRYRRLMAVCEGEEKLGAPAP
jgi:hypothetical protein